MAPKAWFLWNFFLLLTDAVSGFGWFFITGLLMDNRINRVLISRNSHKFKMNINEHKHIIKKTWEKEKKRNFKICNYCVFLNEPL
jgi:hypothetical protein